ncbi:transposase [Halomonas sp. ZH2S]|uniref:Transposase n=1 Tax=Vreelandella zhuhanensis TaxID=2684210 RepID=A0A7X3KRF7_9GAMM|nr:transposase [Halomonas zhuhanensis]MWJ29519.1 transposase [Halomonas zhuhanensis]
MNQKKANSYTDEFREGAVKLAIESDQSVAQTARELGINVNTLHTWINKYQEQLPSGSAKQEGQHLYDELKQLRRENARLKEERAILKKAAAFFAKESL